VVLLILLGATLLSCLWAVNAPRYLVPGASDLSRSLREDSGTYLQHLRFTVADALGGFLVGNGLAVVGALILTNSAKGLESVATAIATLGRAIPIVALTPVLALWMGYGSGTKIVAISLMLFFPTFIMTVAGLRAVDAEMLDMLLVLGADELSILLKARLPASLPYIFAAIRVAAPTAVLGALIVEWLGSGSGLGALMATASYGYRTDMLWVSVFLASTLGLVAYLIVEGCERAVRRWIYNERLVDSGGDE
jgi:NitT/TauT family transport system permease protein